MAAHRCVVCEGRGKLGWLRKRPCHGCEGKGWVEISTTDTLATYLAGMIANSKGFPWRPLAVAGIIIGGGYLLLGVLDP